MHPDCNLCVTQARTCESQPPELPITSRKSRAPPFVEYLQTIAIATVSLMSSSGRFSSRKHNLLFDALQASGQTSGDYTDFNRCMSEAKARGLTWVQGLDYTVKKLQPIAAASQDHPPQQ